MSGTHIKIMVDIPVGGPTLLELLDMLPGNPDYPLTYHRAIRRARQGDMVQCSLTRCIYIYDRAQDCLSCDQGQPNEVEQRLSWRIVPQEEVQS